jgi:dipeptidyl aminopeptidase/acylaminoacyl peptidase
MAPVYARLPARALSRAAHSTLREDFMMSRTITLAFVVALIWPAGPGVAQDKRTLTPDDVFNLKTVSDPQISPDGGWVAYRVAWLDRKEDARTADLYMAPFGGGEAVQLTRHSEAERHARWSPDGRHLAFLAKRDGKHTQVWLLDRRGGEPTALTEYKADVSELAWSPDSSRLALIVTDVDPDDAANVPDGERDAAERKAPKPIVVTRLQFKRDGEGFLNDLRPHVHVFDIAKKSSIQITTGAFDDESPRWSRDGRSVVFVSNRTEQPDTNENTDLFIVSADGSAPPRNLTSSPESESSPEFSPDGRWLTFIKGGKPSDIWYATNNLAVMPADGGPPRILTDGVDRNLSSPRFSHDGGSIYVIVEDGGSAHLARVSAGGGRLERVVAGERDVEAFSIGARGELVVLETSVHQPSEISRVETGGTLARVTRTNDAFLSGITLGKVERFKARSKDGTSIDAFLTRPPDRPTATRLPTILRIHGGPVSQYSTSFELEWQMLAAAGYAVVAANPRGSSGRGRDFSYAIWADWGNKDYQDVMAAVDEAVAMGVADPDRLGVGGWSYGGILTNLVLVQTTRFKGAISGASEVNYAANYGHDHYQREWEAELGLPWKNLARWNEMSPFFRVENITTPTLILCGQEDWNVPLLNSEQLFQALRRLGRTTELVIYPGQSHSIVRPSYQKDRYERYIAWYDKYVKGAAPATQ